MPTNHLGSIEVAAPQVPLIEATHLTKRYGSVTALHDVSLTVRSGEVTCLLGDNGAGKSSLIQILAGVTHQDEGELRLFGEQTRLNSPGDALKLGIATVFQDLAIVPVMPIYRNFFLGEEPLKGRTPLRWFDKARAKRITVDELLRIGIQIADPTRPIASLSGGERQCVAIARAVYFGARILILDEPTSALGVREAEIVLRYIVEARAAGLGVIFVTHNAHHAYPVGDTFVILRRGELEGTFRRGELTPVDLVRHMAGGAELARLERDLAGLVYEEVENVDDSR